MRLSRLPQFGSHVLINRGDLVRKSTQDLPDDASGQQRSEATDTFTRSVEKPFVDAGWTVVTSSPVFPADHFLYMTKPERPKSRYEDSPVLDTLHQQGIGHGYSPEVFDTHNPETTRSALFPASDNRVLSTEAAQEAALAMKPYSTLSQFKPPEPKRHLT
ncbi:MAG: hypothetical protein K2X01_01370 [Cyanobacteria bacterium]|nr:hypothetical protein [Cyanobacteriota bacterium]